MPTFVHGSKAKVLANGYDLSTYFKSVASTSTVETSEVSTLGATSKAYIVGLDDGKLSVDGFYDPSTGASDAVLQGIIGTTSLWTCVMGVDAVGARGYGASTIETSVATGADIGGAVSVKAEGQATGGVDAITVLTPVSAVTATANGTASDNAVLTSNGAASYLHIVASTGASQTLVVKLQHSVDNSAWVDLATHTTVTTTAHIAERIAVTGTVNRYLRTLVTITGTGPSFTIHHAAARL
jgi:hypothetical protein